jgi:hypothetical protein
MERCVSSALENSWFVIDLKDREVNPTHYTLRHYASYDTEALRNWRLEVRFLSIRCLPVSVMRKFRTLPVTRTQSSRPSFPQNSHKQRKK